ncbi:MAG: tyrosine-type recombinase/integrase [Leadbetterella sp.]
MVDFFISYLHSERRLSQHTTTAYQADISDFEDFFSGDSIVSAKSVDIREWIVCLSEKGLQHTSINRKLASLKAFFSFLVLKKEISENPTKGIKNLKMSKKLPFFYSEGSLSSFEQLSVFGSSFSDVRDHLLIELLYGTGIRLSELIELNENDVDFFQSKIKVMGKRAKERFVPIHKELQRLIQNYQELKKNQFSEQRPFLFVTDKNDKLYPMFVQRKVKTYLDLVSTVQKKSPHIIRHSFATHLLNRGADLNAIKDLLGHSSLSATQIYTHNSISKLKEIHSKSHPKA